MTDTDWTYRRPTGKEVLSRGLTGGGILALVLTLHLGHGLSSAGPLEYAVVIASFVAAVAGIALGITNRREHKAARSSDAA